MEAYSTPLVLLAQYGGSLKLFLCLCVRYAYYQSGDGDWREYNGSYGTAMYVSWPKR